MVVSQVQRGDGDRDSTGDGAAVPLYPLRFRTESRTDGALRWPRVDCTRDPADTARAGGYIAGLLRSVVVLYWKWGTSGSTGAIQRCWSAIEVAGDRLHCNASHGGIIKLQTRQIPT